ncbi:MAG: Ig-like domain-containing protein [Planctomycetota bacterium]
MNIFLNRNVSTAFRRQGKAMKKHLSSLVFLLGLGITLAASGADSHPIPECRALPPFNHTLNLLEQRANNKLAVSYHTYMTNPGVEPKAIGSADLQLGVTRTAFNEKFTVSLSKLLPNTTYQLNVFIGDNVASTKAVSIRTDATGAFSAVYAKGKTVRGSITVPDAMHPVHGLRELDVVNASSQVVLRAILAAPDILKYQASLQMHNTGFVPAATATMVIKATPTKLTLVLAAKKLQPSTPYEFVINGMNYSLVTSDSKGGLKRTFNDAMLDVFDIRTIALTDIGITHVVLVLFPGSGNGIFPANTTMPTVISTNPTSGKTGVPINATVNASFNEGLDASTITSTLSSNGNFYLVSSNGNFVQGTVTYASATATATFTPATNLLANTTYTATITTGVADLGGNELQSTYSWTFTTAVGNTTPPQVSFTAPTNGDVAVPINRKLLVAFSEAMDPLTLTATTFTLTGPGVTSVTGTIAYVGTTATFTPAGNLANSTLYTATITTKARDLAGNALASNFVWTFTTGLSADTTAPTVSFTAPSNNAVAVPINEIGNVAFSQVMDPLTLTTATFTLTGPGATPVTGTVACVGPTATFTPAGNLAANTLYTATITTGAKDLAGNALASNFVWTFSTGAVTDTTAPTVSFTSPANGAADVAINRIINVAFSEAMDPLTVTTTTFTVTGPGVTPVTGIVAYFGTTATFTPAGNLANSTLYTATITTGTKDLAGNALASNFVWNFTTGAGADTTPPTVSFTSPTNGAVAVPINRIISVAFSKAMDPLTLTTTTFTVTGPGATPVTGTVAYIGTTATFTPAGNLATSTPYTATITTGAKDLAGNALASNFAWSFTTGASADTTAPTVTFTSPANGAADVAINRIINVAFSKVMDPLTVTTTTFTLAGPGVIPVTGTVASVGTTATFIPVANLADNTLYTATITTGAKDLAGNALASNFVWTFTTATVADTTPPTVIFTSPTAGAIAVPINQKTNVTFSKVMDPLTITNLTFTLEAPVGTPVLGTVSYSGVTAVFIPKSNLASSTLYTVTVKGGAGGATDLAGNPLASNFVWSWTTGAAPDNTPPTVTGTSNANGAINVPLNTHVGATFSEAMDPLTITNLTFTLEAPVGTPVKGTVFYSAMTAVFIPLSNLAPSTLYTATIIGGASGATDLAGNPLASNYVWSWTTGTAADTTPPTVTLVSPANLATGVDINSTVKATFSKAMLLSTINKATFTLVQTVSGASSNGNVTYLDTTKTATFTPPSPLSPNTSYTATITIGATDSNGIALANNYVWSFTTGTVLAPGAVALGSASTYGIMAVGGLSNTGPSVINGDVSLNPATSSSMVGFPPGVVNGSVHIDDSVAQQAEQDLLAAYSWAKGLPVGTAVPDGSNLGAFNGTGILAPGTYTSNSTLTISTPVILDAQGNTNAVWVFQIGSSLTTNGTGNVTLKNGAQSKNVFFVATISATIGANTTFCGTIVTGSGDATGVSGATINGRILAGGLPGSTGAIVLDTNTVNVPKQ